MNTVNKDELFQNLSDFLKAKGIEFKDGSYTQRVRQGCDLLADAVNATQKTVVRAKVQVDRKLDQLRQSIHEATAPKPPPPAAAQTESKQSPRPQAPSPRARKRSARKK